MFSTVPFLPGYRWHRVARGWRRPLVGELMMGAATRWAFRRELPAELADQAWSRFDHGTQRAILKLYRSASPEVLARRRRATRPRAVPGAPAVVDARPVHPRRVRPGLRRRARRTGRARARGRRPLDLARTARAGRAHGVISGSPARLAFYRRAPGRALRSHGAASWPLRRGRARHPPLPAPGGLRAAAAVVAAHRLVAPRPSPRRAGVRGRLPDLAAAHRRPCGAHLPGRPVRPGGLHDLERPVVRRPSHARLQHHLAADRLAARAAACARARGAGLGRALRAAGARLLRSRPRALGLDLVRRGHGHPALHQPAAVRARRGVRAGRPARPPAAPLRAGDRLRPPLPARQPRGRAVPRDGGRGLRARPPRRPLEAARGHRHRGGGLHPAGVPGLGLPRGRLGALPVHRLSADPAVRHRLPDRAAPAGARAPLGGGAVRRRRHAGAVPGHADGRQRRAPRRALRRARAPLRHLGEGLDAQPDGASGCWSAASPRSASGSGRRPCAT